MTLLAADAIAHIRHTLASAGVPDIGALRILNDAGQHMVNMHNWQWCEGAQSTLSLTKDQDYVWLPENFREMIAIQPSNGLNAGFRLTTQDRLLRLRSLAVTNSFEFNAAVVHAPRAKAAEATVTFNSLSPGSNIVIYDAYNPSTTFTFVSALGDANDDTTTERFVVLGSTTTTAADNFAKALNDAPHLYLRASASGAVVTVVHEREGTRGNSMTLTPSGGSQTVLTDDVGVDTGPVRARLDLWPTPSTTEADRLMVYYRAGWAAVESDSQVLAMPDWMESLYLQLVRAFARGYERESEANMDQRLMVIKQGPIYAAAMLRDKEMMPNIGPMAGGAAQCTRRTYDHLWNFTSVSGPS